MGASSFCQIAQELVDVNHLHHHDLEAIPQGFVGCFYWNTEDNFPPFQGVAAADLAEQASDARDCRWAKTSRSWEMDFQTGMNM